jgi:hypothetical protein
MTVPRCYCSWSRACGPISLSSVQGQRVPVGLSDDQADQADQAVAVADGVADRLARAVDPLSLGS